MMIFSFFIFSALGLAAAMLNVYWALDFETPEARSNCIMFFVVVDLLVVVLMTIIMPEAVPYVFIFSLTKLITFINMDMKLFLSIEL